MLGKASFEMHYKGGSTGRRRKNCNNKAENNSGSKVARQGQVGKNSYSVYQRDLCRTR